MTPERIAELRDEYAGKCSPHRHHCNRGGWAWMTLDILELLDAIESAQQEIADLKRGGVVVQEWNANAFALACVASGTYADGDLRAAIRNAEVGYNFAASRLRTIPADRVMGEGQAAVDRDYLADLEEAIIDTVESLNRGFVFCENCGEQEETKSLDVMSMNLLPMKERIDALRAQPTQEPTP